MTGHAQNPMHKLSRLLTDLLWQVSVSHFQSIVHEYAAVYFALYAGAKDHSNSLEKGSLIPQYAVQ